MSETIYTVLTGSAEASSFAQRNGYPPSFNRNNAGGLIIIDKNDDTKPEIPRNLIPLKPDYVEEEFPNWPYLTKEEVKQLTSYQCTSPTNNDGWYYSSRV